MQVKRNFWHLFTGKGLIASSLAGLLLIALTQLVLAAPLLQSADEGAIIFEEKCVACHTIGGGPLVGPDLQDVTARRDSDWLTRWITAPDEMLAEGDPIATELLQESNNIAMPNPQLSEAEVAAVLAYLENPTAVSLSQPDLPEGDLASGEALFTGASRLQNGAPSCMSCHNTAGAGVLGGGTLGPDLTNVYGRYGGLGLAATLKSLPFPSMEGVFIDKPLTDDEVGHLYTYFVQVDQTGAQPVNFNFVLIGLGGFVLLGILSQLTWRKRLTGVRIPLVGR